ncbi:non-ribosomal peptide synthetase [Pantoea ananatis]|uniref:non-ribosomal peptide synthetase n=1 Tax=Pantoea ananas TaxID=553 RepID=UPI0023B07230|nr:non-ribosomal peptide synthetase [Pantoea ananatis]
MNLLINDPVKFSNLIELLQFRAGRSSGHSNKTAFTYLNDGENISGSLTYEELDRQARNIAAHLQKITNPGDRVLLVYPPSLDYIVSFLGCVYAGVIAVPAVPPTNIRTRPRLLSIVNDASPCIAIGTTLTVDRMKSLQVNSDDVLSKLHWLSTDNLGNSSEKWIDPKAKSNDIVFLQYTSGSTGTPKGVMVSHDNLLSNVSLSKNVYGINDEDTFVSWLPPHHDFGLIGGIIFPLFVGCHCIQFPPAIFFAKPYRWLKILSLYRAKMTGAPNFAYEMCVKKVTEEQKKSLDLSELQVAVNGAERIRFETLKRFSDAFKICGFKAESFTPAYGLAESTLFVAAEVKRNKGQLPKTINLKKDALSNDSIIESYDQNDSIILVSNGSTTHGQHHIKIVNPDSLLPLAQGFVGEILVHSPSVAQGYWNRLEESKKTFETKIIGDSRPYLKTGDLGFIYNGDLFIAGRIKELMIFNGRNFYPQDIESTIEKLDPAFRANGCAAFSLENNNGTQLVIVQEIESKQKPKTESIVSLIWTELAETHEIYDLHAVVLVKAGHLPRTSSGKIQRVLCSELYKSNLLSKIWIWENKSLNITNGDREYYPPESNCERIVSKIWQDVLLISEISRHDNFFELGGHSLLATQVLARLRDAFNIDLPLKILFESHSLFDLACRIEAFKPASTVITLPIEKTDRLLPLPLSFSQQRLWFLNQLDESSALYNIPAAVKLTGNLNLEALRIAFNKIVERHETLRTAFVAKGSTPFQTIATHLDLPVAVADLSDLPRPERQRQVASLAQSEALRPFNLTEGPLVRVRVLRLEHDSHVVLLTLHHIIADGWSMGILIKELSAFYTAYLDDKPAFLPELSIQYADYAHWQRQLLSGDELQRQGDYWRKQLSDIPVLLDLPTDRPRPLVQRHQGASVKFVIPASTVQALSALSLQGQGTLFMTLVAAFSILLSRYAGQNDVCIGTPIANRQRAEIEPLIGFFVNTLVLRNRIDHSKNFSELLQQVRATTLEAYAHQDLPFEQVVEILNPERHTGHAPLFQVMLAMQNTTAETLELPGLVMESLASENLMTKFDLLLNLTEVGNHLTAQLDYNVDLFEPVTINRLAEHFQTLLAGIAARPAARISDLPMLGDAELRQLLEWNNTTVEYLHPCIHQQFEAQAESTPDNIALVFNEKQLSYSELNRRANQLAHYLREAGVGPDVLVGICVERSLEMIIAVLGILKAGGAYLPLDPSYPAARIAFMLEDAKPLLLLTQDHLQAALAVHEALPVIFCLDTQWEALNNRRADNLTNLTVPEHLAYVIYTSGSTGRPKGVCIQHSAVMNLKDALLSRIYTPLGGAHGKRVGLNASISFDASVKQWLLLLTGASLYIIPEQLRSDSYGMAASVADWKLDVLDCTPSQLPLLLDAGREHFPKAYLIGGEAIDQQLWDRIGQYKEQSFYNVYGPTEATVDSIICNIHASGPCPVLGCPIDNVQIHILDTALNQVPVGVKGEIYIGGKGLARGYLNQPELTAEKFIPNPYNETSGGRLYKSGDLGRRMTDGTIVYLGRIDDQVKIRGFRIELGEIEAAISSLIGVKDAIVSVRETTHGDKQLVAYVKAENELTLPSYEELRLQLLQKLPAYMVPVHFVDVKEWPLTSNGKINRQALPEVKDLNDKKDYVAPLTKTEKMLADVWAGVLRVERIGRHDNFFELGGHSLLATQVLARLRDAFNIDLPLKILFESHSLFDLACRIEAFKPASTVITLPIEKTDRLLPLPLSFSQQRLWFLNQLDESSALYNIPAAVKLTGNLNLEALRIAFNKIVERHETLRTAFVAKGSTPFQTIATHLDLPVAVADLSDLPRPERQRQVASLAQSEALRPFNLTEGPLVRVRVLRLEHDSHVVLLTLHHIIADGWSMGILIKELSAFYTAYLDDKPAFLPELSIQYADYAHWQRQLLSGDELQRQGDYWRKQLSDIPVLLDLPTDRPRPLVQRHQGASVKFVIPASTVQALSALSLQGQGTLFMTLVAAFSILLSRYAGQNDVCIGTPIANRQRAEIEPLIGFFVNTLVLRNRIDHSKNFSELLQQVRATTLEAYAHQDLPFEQVVEILNPERHTGHAPLFQVMLAMQNTTAETLELPGLVMESLASENLMTKFDLLLNLTEVGNHLTAQLDYNVDLFEPVTINRLAEHFQTLLAGIAARPAARISDLPMLGDAELRQLLEWNNTTVEYLHPCIHQQFEAQAESTPDNIALVFNEKQLSYSELNRRANQLAHYLREAGVGPDVLVGICVERSLEMIIAVLGILKAGGAYLPLDPSYPAARIAFMLEDAKPLLLLTQDHLQAALAVHEALPVIFCLDTQWEALNNRRADNLTNLTVPEHLAYVIYTSGSTGRPKGVCIQHSAVMNLKDALLSRIYTPLGGAHGKRVGLNASISFDASVKQWLLLLTGASLYIIPEQLRSDSYGMAASVADWKLDVLDCTPSQLPLLLDAGREHFPKAYLIGGEAIDQQLWDRIGQYKEQSFYNVYGPTEATVDSIICNIHASGPCPVLGCPIDNVQIHILDTALNQVPVGVKGEIYIGGKGLARGYLNQPELTAEKFIPNPYNETSGGRLYKSGDLGRRMTDGTIVYLGRIDDQVKIRGFRIELGEIEAAISSLIGVKDAIVSVRETTHGDKQLVAYVKAENELTLPSYEELRLQLLQKLPAYMVPVHFVDVKEWPLTSNGKINRQALPEVKDLNDKKDYVAPLTKTEKMLADVWAGVLRVERIGRHDNFFELGGHSLLTTKVAARLRKILNLEIPLQILFNKPELMMLAKEIDSITDEHYETKIPIISVKKRPNILPLSYAQEQLWLLEKIEMMGSAYNISGAVRFTGFLDIVALDKSFNELVSRHETLRTRFVENDQELEQVIDKHANSQLELINLEGLTKDEQNKIEEEKVKEITNKRFDLEKGHLLRACIIKRSPRENTLLLVMHHIISDGWSLNIMINELGLLYSAYSKGKDIDLPKLSIQYADYSIWQREWLKGEVLNRKMLYWKNKLSNIQNSLELPLDMKRPLVQSYRGESVGFILSESLTTQLKDLSLKENATVFILLTAIFKHLLARWSGQEDIIIGTPVAGRTDYGTEGLIGFFINILVLRTEVNQDLTLRQLVARVKKTSLEAYQHQEVPFEKLVEEINPIRDLSLHPIIQVMINSTLTDGNAEQFKEFGIKAELFPIEKVNARFDLMLRINEREGVTNFKIDYAKDLFHKSTIERFAEQYKLLLEKAIENSDVPLSEIDIINSYERNAILCEWNKEIDLENETILEVLFSLAQKKPDNVCIKSQSETISYYELDVLSNKLTNKLNLKGIKKGECVGLIMTNSTETIVAMVSILKAGACLLPINLNYPLEHLNEINKVSKVKYIVGGGGDNTFNLEQCMDFDIEKIIKMDGLGNFSSDFDKLILKGSDIAYFTPVFNELGVDKFAKINHASLARFLKLNELSFRKRQCYKFTVTDILLSLATGNLIHLDEVSQSFKNITIKNKTFNECKFSKRRRVCTNPLEVGRPYILDQNLKPLSIGIAGELFFESYTCDIESMEYIGFSEKDFLLSPFNKEKTLYRSGKQAKWNPDGDLILIENSYSDLNGNYEFGYNEIESALKKVSSAKDVAVKHICDENGVEILIGFISIEENAKNKITAEEIKLELHKILPKEKIPEQIHLLIDFPLTSKGLTNWDGLSLYEKSEKKYEAPQTETEKKVASIWEEILSVESVSLNDNFFELGGHSLLATLVSARIREEYDIEISLRSMFESKTMKSLASLIENIVWAKHKNSYTPRENADGEEFGSI